jgi:hypothetical protein
MRLRPARQSLPLVSVSTDVPLAEVLVAVRPQRALVQVDAQAGCRRERDVAALLEQRRSSDLLAEALEFDQIYL